MQLSGDRHRNGEGKSGIRYVLMKRNSGVMMMTEMMSAGKKSGLVQCGDNNNSCAREMIQTSAPR